MTPNIVLHFWHCRGAKIIGITWFFILTIQTCCFIVCPLLFEHKWNMLARCVLLFVCWCVWVSERESFDDVVTRFTYTKSRFSFSYNRTKWIKRWSGTNNIIMYVATPKCFIIFLLWNICFFHYLIGRKIKEVSKNKFWILKEHYEIILKQMFTLNNAVNNNTEYGPHLPSNSSNQLQWPILWQLKWHSFYQ